MLYNLNIYILKKKKSIYLKKVYILLKTSFIEYSPYKVE